MARALLPHKLWKNCTVQVFTRESTLIKVKPHRSKMFFYWFCVNERWIRARFCVPFKNLFFGRFCHAFNPYLWRASKVYFISICTPIKGVVKYVWDSGQRCDKSAAKLCLWLKSKACEKCRQMCLSLRSNVWQSCRQMRLRFKSKV